jgi:hypothetical protein
MRLGFAITHQNPNSSQNSGQKPVVQRQKKTRSVPSAGKTMESVSDAKSILFIDYLEKGKTITGEYYSNLLTRLDKKFVRKDPVCKRKKSSFIGAMHPPTKCFGNGKIKKSAL